MAEMDYLLFDLIGLILKDWLWVFTSLSGVITIYNYNRYYLGLKFGH